MAKTVMGSEHVVLWELKKKKKPSDKVLENKKRPPMSLHVLNWRTHVKVGSVGQFISNMGGTGLQGNEVSNQRAADITARKNILPDFLQTYHV